EARRVEKFGKLPTPHDGLLAALPWERQVAFVVHSVVVVWKEDGDRCAWSVPGEAPVTALATLPRRKWLAVARGTGPLLVVNENGGLVARLTAHSPPRPAL